jgi:hypothetical protein
VNPPTLKEVGVAIATLSVPELSSAPFTYRRRAPADDTHATWYHRPITGTVVLENTLVRLNGDAKTVWTVATLSSRTHAAMVKLAPGSGIVYVSVVPLMLTALPAARPES